MKKTPQEEKDDLIASLRENRRKIVATVMRLPPEARDEVYLGEWSVKDLLAHLEGWDIANIQAVSEVLAGQLPSFYQQIDKDWRTFNSSLVKRYRKEDLGELVGDVEASQRVLLDTLEALPAESLDQDFNVRFKGWQVTVSRLMNAELSDEIEHLAQLEAFLERVEKWFLKTSKLKTHNIFDPYCWRDIMSLSQPLLDWLLDESEPGPRYLALRDVLRLDADAPQLLQARQEAHLHGPIALILDNMDAEGWWVRPAKGQKGATGGGYGPKYRSIDWSLILLAQLGASVEADPRLLTACHYLLDIALADGEKFSYNGKPSGTITCLHGNLLSALLDLGFDDPCLDQAFDWMACTVTGEGLAPQMDKHAVRRYFAYNCGPGFQCGANLKLPCAWGAGKEMLAFGKLPAHRRTPAIDRAIQAGVDFLFSVDPAEATYPSPGTGKPSGNWWKFGFPVFYITDILQVVEALVLLGYKEDPRLANALELVRSKQDAQGRWKMELNYSGKTWGDYGRKGAPNKWVTIRALKALA